MDRIYGIRESHSSYKCFDVADRDGEFAVVAVVRVVGARTPCASGAKLKLEVMNECEFVGDFR
jgi:hypothetical protein